MPKEEMSDHDLLIRIDERVNAIHCWIVEKEKKCKEEDGRIGDLEAWKNRIIGVAIGAGAVAGFIGSLVYGLLSKFLFRG